MCLLLKWSSKISFKAKWVHFVWCISATNNLSLNFYHSNFSHSISVSILTCSISHKPFAGTSHPKLSWLTHLQTNFAMLSFLRSFWAINTHTSGLESGFQEDLMFPFTFSISYSIYSFFRSSQGFTFHWTPMPHFLISLYMQNHSPEINVLKFSIFHYFINRWQNY